MRETKLHIPMTTHTGETISIVGILAQIALPPHEPLEHEPHPMYTSRANAAPIERIRPNIPSSSSSSSSSYRPDITNDPATAHISPNLTNEDDPATMQRLHIKDRVFKRRGYPIYPIDKRDTRGLKIAIILHGVLAHKDQIYHKQLARALPVDSFRFDFRANGETPGEWSMGNLADDVEDLVAVADYLRTKLEYTVEIIIGHSRGGLDGFAWFAKHCPDALPPSLRVPFFVGLAPRFNMANIHERDPVYLSAFAKEGFFSWQAQIAGQDKTLYVYPEQVEQFAAWPTREIALAFPYKTDVLLIHGTADKSVPASDVTSYGNILSGVHRRPGSCCIKLIDNADHLFRGFYPQVVEAIVEWLKERAELTKMGLSAAAIRDRDTLGLARFDPSHYGQGRAGVGLWDNNLSGTGAHGGSGAGMAGGPPQNGPPWLDSRVVAGGAGGISAAQHGEPSPLSRYLNTGVGTPTTPPAASTAAPASSTAEMSNTAAISPSLPPSPPSSPSPKKTAAIAPPDAQDKVSPQVSPASPQSHRSLGQNHSNYPLPPFQLSRLHSSSTLKPRQSDGAGSSSSAAADGSEASRAAGVDGLGVKSRL